MNNYSALDAAIIRKIEHGTRTFTAIAYSDEINELAKQHARQMTQTFRVVDRRLQALRKKGLIEFDNKEWRILDIGESR